MQSWDSIDSQVIIKCWLHCGIVDAPTRATLTTVTYYKKNDIAVEMENLSGLMAQTTIEGDVSEMMDIENDIDVHEEIGDEVESGSDTEDEHEDEQEPVKASEALKSCLTLSAFLHESEDDVSDEIRLLNSITAKVRSLSIKKQKQKTIRDFL